MRLAHSILLITASASSAAALSQVSVNINVPGFVQVAPPPLRYESVPRAMQGQAPGLDIWQMGVERTGIRLASGPMANSPSGLCLYPQPLGGRRWRLALVGGSVAPTRTAPRQG